MAVPNGRALADLSMVTPNSETNLVL